MPFTGASRRVLVACGLALAFFLAILASIHPGDDLESLVFEHYTQAQGLSSNSVMRLYQDRQGFVWIGTSDGLNRFDGYKFTVFRHSPDDPNSLTDNWIDAICEDRKGNLWIGTTAGLNRYDPRTGGFDRYLYGPPGSPNAVFNRIGGVLEDRSGRIWIGTERGIYRLNPDTRRFETFPYDLGRSLGSMDWQSGLLAEAEDGSLWVSSRRGMTRFDPATGRYTPFDLDAARSSLLGHCVISAIRPSRRGGFWVSTFSGLFHFDPMQGRYEAVPLPVPGNGVKSGDVMLNDVLEDGEGNLWVASRIGLFQVSPKDGHVLLHRSEPTAPQGLNHRMVNCLMIDRSGLLWLGTHGGGLNLLDSHRFRFRAWPFVPDSPRSPSDWTVWSFDEDVDGKLWVGTQEGLNRYDPAKGTFEAWRHVEGDPKTLTDNEIRDILAEGDGTVWVCTRHGLNRFHPVRGVLKCYTRQPDVPDSLSDPVVRCVLRDRAGRFWVGTNNGLNLMTDEKKGSFHTWRAEGLIPEGSVLDVRTLCEDAQAPGKVLWLGTSEGLFRFDVPTGVMSRLDWDSKNGPNRVSRQFIFAIHQLSSGPPDELWLGTRASGLLQVNKRTGKCRAVTTRDGLPSDEVYGILEDSWGALWASTNNGLCRYDPAARAVLVFTITDGLPCSEFNSGAFYRGKDGRLYFGGINGYLGFFPRVPSARRVPPPVVITGIEAQGAAVKAEGDLSDNGEIVLPWDLPSFTLEFAALDYSAPWANRYAYRLEGAHADWVPCGTRREVTFANLQPGEYTFRVKGCNRDGAWNETGASLRIVITPPYWRTWWAYALYILAGAGLAWVFIAWRIRAHAAALREKYLEENVQRLQELDELKTGFIGMVSHDLRTPLTSIIGFAALVRKRFVERVKPTLVPVADVQRAADVIVRNAEIIESEGKRLVTIINDLLDLTKLEAGKIRLSPEPVDLSAILVRAGESVVPLLELKQLEWRLDVEENLPQAWGDRDRIMQVVVNLVSNAVKFTDSGSVSVSARRQGSEIVVEVRDTGGGIPENELGSLFDKYHQVEGHHDTFIKGTGLGLPICRQLVELHGGRIQVESALGKGSTFRFTLPAHTEAP
ncbi:MAG: hypothetical protein KA419_19045 [Acidobacteria bacterium]|nr:hypothetical protein [Acidobacteriota bacterium]